MLERILNVFESVCRTMITISGISAIRNTEITMINIIVVLLASLLWWTFFIRESWLVIISNFELFLISTIDLPSEYVLSFGYLADMSLKIVKLKVLN